MPKVGSSTCTRRYPSSDSLSRTRRKASTRMERTVSGQPARFGLGLAACRRAIRSRCQRTIMSGRTSSRNRRTTSGGKRCSNTARKARSHGVNRAFCSPSWRAQHWQCSEVTHHPLDMPLIRWRRAAGRTPGGDAPPARRRLSHQRQKNLDADPQRLGRVSLGTRNRYRRAQPTRHGEIRLSTRAQRRTRTRRPRPDPRRPRPGGMYITRELNTRSVRTAPLLDRRRLLLITGEAFPPGAGQPQRHLGPGCGRDLGTGPYTRLPG